ncbi:EAL domain-containing protein [Enterovirga aerilata]|uniref:Bifunctional diguanylate cyclase/phosphodiesterase n=1 Tax=Enterovirga aerilata TaxID=2730920 RepID=A0A849IAL9_9HYPH|nr:bifunctional diguanylate cyclase/phosphodiesterase [Enterovirga sp. DB1703]NNM71003.1 bifunctional diguanylate cyclase/phosphodiesterase [Enterovirga sp. DB1703]
MSGLAQPRLPDHLPSDPRGILTSIGVAVYDWDIAADRLTWAPNAAEVIGLQDLSAFSSGRDFAGIVEPGSGIARSEAILGSAVRDEGSGVPYSTRYAVRPTPHRLILVEDTGRWYAGADGRPAVAHGMLRISQAESEGQAHEGPGQRERTAFLRQIAGDVGEASRSRRPLTVFAIAIENLSQLNDELGFDGADQVVQEVLARMRVVMRRRDGFTRYSGNRFALALRACPPDQARIAAERLNAAVSGAPVATAQGPVAVRILIGGATAPDHALDAAGLLRRAEQSLAVVKRRSGASFVHYDPEIFRSGERPAGSQGALDVIGLLNARRIAFARQPVVDASTREVVFSEALLRITGEDGRVATAGDVVPAMERSGLVPLVDMRILELAAERLARHPEERLSVNISPLTLESPDWLATLAAHVGRRSDIASRLIVEVTETVAIRDPDMARRKLDAMKALGVTIAIDDFGAGHTSFRHLRNFPVDIVKIDGAFIQNLSRSTNDRFFVQTLIDLAHHLGLSTVAEWVEDEETARMLAKWGVDYLQGDYCGLPRLSLEAPPREAARVA